MCVIVKHPKTPNRPLIVGEKVSGGSHSGQPTTQLREGGGVPAHAGIRPLPRKSFKNKTCGIAFVTPLNVDLWTRHKHVLMYAYATYTYYGSVYLSGSNH